MHVVFGEQYKIIIIVIIIIIIIIVTTIKHRKYNYIYIF